ncbi:MAG: TAT-variant-translocated molybdopterin oxidoreductase [Bacteroidetes bacterium]|nr:TAT-variant-translocated molybdopterin oxidoreductase [Bacteroidota bacterium]HET6244775.1 TAT-variant-translocated molybdopterin oxidoreductase [Bacteroidia bacterium]
MGTTKKYWKSLAQLNEDPEFVNSSKKEFAEEMPLESFLGDDNLAESSTNRRDFLKVLGFSVTAASLAACETPVIKAVPYLNKPEEVTPGVANWYASSYFDGNDYASILVKTREGRPIHITGNKNSSITGAGVNARVNSSVLSLYDSTRLNGPLAAGSPTTWNSVDGEITKQMEQIAAQGGNIRILSHSIISPSTKQVIADFSAKYPNVVHVNYDTISYSGIIKANQASFGKAAFPSLNFSNAKVVVTIAADFMGGWGSSIEYLTQFAKTRRPENGWMSRMYAFESNLSLTGSNADVRVPVKPSEQGLAALALYNEIAKKSGAQTLSNVEVPFKNTISKAAEELWANRGSSLVVAGSNDIAVQTIVNAINSLLGNYGKTIDLNNADLTKQGDDANVDQLVKDMNSGAVAALFIYGVNPVYSLPNGDAFAQGLSKVKLSVSFSDKEDETASLVNYVCPDHHYLESWNDLQPRTSKYSLAQPTISPLFNTRQVQDSLLKWSGSDLSYYSFIRNTWNDRIFPLQTTNTLFDSFWNNTLHDGVFEIPVQQAEPVSFGADLSGSASKITTVKPGELELALYQKISMGDGNQANNPWLQELPDPVTRITWDNYITMAPQQMQEINWKFGLLARGEDEADVAEVVVNGISIKLPVVPQPGQAYGTIGIALGYGRTKAGKAGNEVGKNAFPLATFANGTYNYTISSVSISKTGEKHQIASVQQHHTLMGREIVKETILTDYLADPKSGNPDIMLATFKGPQLVSKVDLWREHPVDTIGHRWAMTIDLNTCFGCGACVTACHSENNVPVVGKDEVRRGRDMHWLRIDRYFSSAMTKKKAADENVGAIDMYLEMEVPEAENPEVSFQPMLCQHCNHAPCETVCPVAATTHSNEGLNQMTYNRCIGTRYCANNCPYKVRRFNWFSYPGNEKFADVNPAMDQLSKMVLNPDVIVRGRGVMEKCSFCVQKIQAGKLVAKKEKRKIADGDVVTACASACPTNAIVFGDYNDMASNDGKGSEVKINSANPRAYHVIEEVGTKPNIWYMTKVRNKSQEQA